MKRILIVLVIGLLAISCKNQKQFVKQASDIIDSSIESAIKSNVAKDNLIKYYPDAIKYLKKQGDTIAYFDPVDVALIRDNEDTLEARWMTDFSVNNYEEDRLMRRFRSFQGKISDHIYDSLAFSHDYILKSLDFNKNQH